MRRQSRSLFYDGKGNGFLVILYTSSGLYVYVWVANVLSLRKIILYVFDGLFITVVYRTSFVVRSGGTLEPSENSLQRFNFKVDAMRVAIGLQAVQYKNLEVSGELKFEVHTRDWVYWR